MEIYSKILSGQMTRTLFGGSPKFSSHDSKAQMGANPFSGVAKMIGRDAESIKRRKNAGGGGTPPGDAPPPDSKDSGDAPTGKGGKAIKRPTSGTKAATGKTKK